MEKDNKVKVLLWLIIFVFVFISGFFLGDFKDELSKKVGLKSNEVEYTLSGDLKKEYESVDVDLLWEIWGYLESQYIDRSVDGQALLYGAAKGLVSGLDDPYTSYLTPEETQQYFSSNKGEFEGIGATLKMEGDLVAVESPIDGAPAQKAGIKAGDIILTVDGDDVQGLSVVQVASEIRGEAGTNVVIGIYRPDGDERLEITVERSKIDLDNIELRKIENGVAEVKIYKFTEESVEAFNSSWDNIVEQMLAKDVNKVIIDLRNNPGGYVNSVEYVLGEFLKKGQVVFKEEDRNGKIEEFKVARNGKFTDVELVVLVNGGSASASEIFAGAIQDHGRGKIIGQGTVGKGVEQKLITLSDGSTLQLTFQRWLTPNGKNISADDPISPDIEVEEYDAQTDKAYEELGVEN